MGKSQDNRSKYIFGFLRIAVVAGGIIWGIVWISDKQRWENLVEAFGRMNMWVFAGVVGIFIVSHAIVGSRWWLLLGTQSIHIGFWAAIRLYFLGWFYNNFMPSSVGGDLIRAWYVTKHTEKRLEAALSVFVDRVIGLFSTLTIAIFFYLLFMHGQGREMSFSKPSGFLKLISEYRCYIYGGVTGVLSVFVVLLINSRGRAVLIKAWSYIYARGRRVVVKLKDAVVIYCKSPVILLVAYGLTVCMQIMVITGFWFLGRSMGIETSIKYYYVFFTLTWVLGAIPVSIGGAVVVEGSLVVLFTQFAGIDEPAALAIALCQRIIWMLTSLPGAVIHLIGAHLPKDFSVDYNNAID